MNSDENRNKVITSVSLYEETRQQLAAMAAVNPLYNQSVLIRAGIMLFATQAPGARSQQIVDAMRGGLQGNTPLHGTSVRLGEDGRHQLSAMARENPLYTQSVVIRAAVQMLSTLSPDARDSLIIASLASDELSTLSGAAGEPVPAEYPAP